MKRIFITKIYICNYTTFETCIGTPGFREHFGRGLRLFLDTPIVLLSKQKKTTTNVSLTSSNNPAGQYDGLNQ